MASQVPFDTATAYRPLTRALPIRISELSICRSWGIRNPFTLAFCLRQVSHAAVTACLEATRGLEYLSAGGGLATAGNKRRNGRSSSVSARLDSGIYPIHGALRSSTLRAAIGWTSDVGRFRIIRRDV